MIVPPLALDHAPPDRLGHEERPAHVDGHDPVELLGWHLVRRRSPRRATVVDENVDAPEGFMRCCDDPLDVFLLRDVAR